MPDASGAHCAQVRNYKGEWREVAMGRGIKALVLLNLQSYAGGRDLWGLRDPARDARKGWRTPIFNDGLIEARGGAPLHSFIMLMQPCASPMMPALWPHRGEGGYFCPFSLQLLQPCAHRHDGKTEPGMRAVLPVCLQADWLSS
jgi:hypothetical protein